MFLLITLFGSLIVLTILTLDYFESKNEQKKLDKPTIILADPSPSEDSVTKDYVDAFKMINDIRQTKIFGPDVIINNNDHEFLTRVNNEQIKTLQTSGIRTRTNKTSKKRSKKTKSNNKIFRKRTRVRAKQKS